MVEKNNVPYNITSFGAVADGKTVNTKAIQSAIDAAAGNGGGTILVPAGRFVTGSLLLKSNTTLNLDAGAVLLGSQDFEDFPLFSNPYYKEGGMMHSPLIGAEKQSNIALTGRGLIDGRGEKWWKERDKLAEKKIDRPRLIHLKACKNVLIEGVSLTNSPQWTVVPIDCENVRICGINISNPYNSPNTDGINPDGCRNVRISGCHIDVGDDCVTFKSGRETDRRDPPTPCENIAITNCTMVHGHGGVVMGSEMSSGVRNIVISNCIFIGTERGIRLKSRRGRGGAIEDVRVDNIVMKGVKIPFVLDLYYPCGATDNKAFSKDACPVNEGTPAIRNIHLSNITARGSLSSAGYIYGLQESPIEGITFDNIEITVADNPDLKYWDFIGTLPEGSGSGFFCRFARNLRFSNVSISTQLGAALELHSVENVTVSNLSSPAPRGNAPVILMNGVKDAFIRGCRASEGTGDFLRLEGKETVAIALSGNDLGKAKTPVLAGKDVSPKAVKEL